MTILSSRPFRVAALAVGGVALFTFPSRAGVLPPAVFPNTVNMAATAYTLQFAGDVREGTAAAIALNAAASKGRTAGYPFQSSTPNIDPSSSAYGPSTCPKTLVLAADDTPADALAAAGLYGVTALALTDRAGKPLTVDTLGAELLLTQSGREGASQLDSTTNATITHIKSACSGTTINGIALGGAVALPDSVVDEFKTQVADVARIAGADRNDTARQIAVAVAGPNGAGLPTIHYFSSPGSFGSTTGSAALAKTVFLAENLTGADALSVGAVAARLGVPILLTNSTALPQATANAMGALAPQNIVVLGGTDAIADGVVASAKSFAGSGSTAVRIFGANRYATSVAIAEQLFNLYPDYVPKVGAAAYTGQLFGLARDEGTAAAGNHVGWPDALASAYYMASLAGGSAPARNAPGVEKSRSDDGAGTATFVNLTPAACGASGSVCSPYFPLLLTQGSSLSPEVDGYLKAMYPAGTQYKTGSNPTGANDGGFGFVFGGFASVSPATVAGYATDLSGQSYAPAAATDLNPHMPGSSVFYTTVSLANFVGGMLPTAGTATFTGAAASAQGPQPTGKVCVMPGTVSGLAGVTEVNDQGGVAATNPVNYFGTGTAYAPGTSLGSCVDVATASPASKTFAAGFFGSSLSGNVTTGVQVNYGPSVTLDVRATGNSPQGGAQDTGSVFSGIPSGQSSEAETAAYTGVPLMSATYKGTSISGGTADITLHLVRAKGQNNKDIVGWTGSVTVKNGSTTVFTATITQGVSDQTPATGSAINGPINLMGLYQAPGLGGAVLTLNPAVIPSTPSSISNIELSGGA